MPFQRQSQFLRGAAAVNELRGHRWTALGLLLFCCDDAVTRAEAQVESIVAAAVLL